MVKSSRHNNPLPDPHQTKTDYLLRIVEGLVHSVADVADSLSAFENKVSRQFNAVADSISTLSDTVDQQFDEVKDDIRLLRFDFGTRLTNLESAQRQTNVRLSALEGESTATRADIKELYQLVSN